MEPVPAKKIERFTFLIVTCGQCGKEFHLEAGKEVWPCYSCGATNNLATTWNEREYE